MYFKRYELVQVRIDTDILIGRIVKGPENGRYLVCFDLDKPLNRIAWLKDNKWIDRSFIVKA